MSCLVLPNDSRSDLSGLSCPSAADDSDAAAGYGSAASAHLPNAPKYKCPLCSLRFRRRDALDRHEAHHTGVRRFRCTVRADCRRQYTNASHLRRHVRTVHPESLAAGGDSAASAAAAAPSDLRAGFVVGGFRCAQPGCPRVFVTAAAAALHASQTHQKRKQHQCGECAEAFYRKQQLRAHQFQHTGQHPYRCDQCAAGFLNRRQLQRHSGGCSAKAGEASEAGSSSSSRPAAQLQCEVCQQHFGKWSELVAHRRSEHRPRCPLCDRTFASAANMRAHRQSVHKEATEEEAVPAEVFVCPEAGCGKEFRYERNMRAHWRLMHGDQRFGCERCGLELSSKQKLEQHADWHRRHPQYVVQRRGKKEEGKGGGGGAVEKRFGCEVDGCGRRYVRRQALVEHVRKSHPGQAVPECGGRLTVAQRLAGIGMAVEEEAESDIGQPAEADDLDASVAETCPDRGEKGLEGESDLAVSEEKLLLCEAECMTTK